MSVQNARSRLESIEEQLANIILVNWTTHFSLFFPAPTYQNMENTTDSRSVRDCQIQRKITCYGQ